MMPQPKPCVSCDLRPVRAQFVGPQEVTDSYCIPVKNGTPRRQRSS